MDHSPYDSCLVAEALIKTMETNPEFRIRMEDGKQVSADEMRQMIVARDARAINFLQDVVSTAISILRIRGRVEK